VHYKDFKADPKKFAVRVTEKRHEILFLCSGNLMLPVLDYQSSFKIVV
jgi:hypothetical protein